MKKNFLKKSAKMVILGVFALFWKNFRKFFSKFLKKNFPFFQKKLKLAISNYFSILHRFTHVSDTKNA